MTRVRLLILLLALPVGGCFAYDAANVPLAQWSPTYGYRSQEVAAKRPVGEVLLLLAFSGGGTRAAALSYGVLRALRDTPLPHEDARTVLDEVDLITSVSGGSFTSAYYGLFDKRIFTDFERVFLRRDVEGLLIRALLNPINWVRLANPFFSRTDLAVRLYNQEIFDGATFADLEAADGPFITINATDIGAGGPFTFFQPQFDLLCSDLSKLEIARAVTASSGVPGLFAPITLRNYTGTCGYVRPEWLDASLKTRSTSPRRFRNAESMVGYLDAKKDKYIHLLDGGIADNIGLRRPLDSVILEGGIWQALKQDGVKRPKQIVVIVVNAANKPDQHFDFLPEPPSLTSILNAVTDVQIHRYNFETVELMRESLKEWASETPPDDEGHKLQTHMVEISFEILESAEEREFFDNIPTNFDLDSETVDRLIEVGGRLLRASPDFQEFLGSM